MAEREQYENDYRTSFEEFEARLKSSEEQRTVLVLTPTEYLSGGHPTHDASGRALLSVIALPSGNILDPERQPAEANLEFAQIRRDFLIAALEGRQVEPATSKEMERFLEPMRTAETGHKYLVPEAAPHHAEPAQTHFPSVFSVSQIKDPEETLEKLNKDREKVRAMTDGGELGLQANMLAANVGHRHYAAWQMLNDYDTVRRGIDPVYAKENKEFWREHRDTNDLVKASMDKPWFSFTDSKEWQHLREIRARSAETGVDLSEAIADPTIVGLDRESLGSIATPDRKLQERAPVAPTREWIRQQVQESAAQWTQNNRDQKQDSLARSFSNASDAIQGVGQGQSLEAANRALVALRAEINSAAEALRHEQDPQRRQAMMGALEDGMRGVSQAAATLAPQTADQQAGALGIQSAVSRLDSDMRSLGLQPEIKQQMTGVTADQMIQEQYGTKVNAKEELEMKMR